MKTVHRDGLRSFLVSTLLGFGSLASATTLFIEAEDLAVSGDGWRRTANRSASGVTTLHGASGAPDGVATTNITLAVGGNYRVWTRYIHHSRWRGPFTLTVRTGDGEPVSRTYDLEPREDARDWGGVWVPMDLALPAGEIELRLSKHENRNCTGYVRHVDCLLLTDDMDLVPDHRDYGPQTYVRVKVGAPYEEPVYVHIFADHYRAPWYSHHYLASQGAGNGLQPRNDQRLPAGAATPWCNITRMLYQDSGAILNFTLRHRYHRRPERMQARFEFATAPDEASVVRAMDVTAEPNGLVVVMPPNLVTEENRARLGRDKDFAERTGALADGMDWPDIGKKPERFPFFVAASIGGYGTPPDQSVIDRERRTLDYFGFSNWTRKQLHAGTWRMIGNSYCRPDMTAITNMAARRAAELHASGQGPDDVAYCMLMDEPTGQKLKFMAGDAAYQESFREWLRNRLGLTPAQLLVTDWPEVRTVTREERETYPALYYTSQRFRTRALGDFMALQRKALTEACGGNFPVNVNFSDGATYHANFYTQGVDYFELLDDDGQNAIWGEDWANGSSSYQCGAYNVDLMRAAARDRGQTIGHYLIAHAGRKPLDVKLKAAGNVARGAKMLKSFSYGVYWGSHEGGPAWRSSVWQNKPEMWIPHAEILREIGGVEDLLLPAMPPPAEVAILYASSSDIWQSGENYAYGFDRMHAWMVLAHAQIPVDFLSEAQVAEGALSDYRVCYLAGPNLTRAAAEAVARWTTDGGRLIVTADAGARDEFDRPMDIISDLLPAQREPLETFQSHRSSGRFLANLNSAGTVAVGATQFDLLSVWQPQVPHEDATVFGRREDGSPAWVRGAAGRGRVDSLGFLPALDYIRQALLARRALTERVKEEKEAAIDGPDAINEERATADIAPEDRLRLQRSANPWAYPADQRETLLTPFRDAGIDPPLVCDTPLVDAVCMEAPEGLVIPLANYTLLPLERVELGLRVARPVKRLESVHQGELAHQLKNGRLVFALPLDSTDYVTVRF